MFRHIFFKYLSDHTLKKKNPTKFHTKVEMTRRSNEKENMTIRSHTKEENEYQIAQQRRN